ncbi:Uncharacterised protein [Orientia tsutsugamushi]|nr:Uncharacterised protein [Orientia tsutsugamushi]
MKIYYTKVNLHIENIVNAEADTLDKFCYMDKAEKFSCKNEFFAFLKKCKFQGIELT